MGFIGFYVIAVWDLWDAHGSTGLRCGTYGMPRGLWDCGLGPMGLPWIYGIAVRALWDAWGLWDCSVAPLEFLCAYRIAV